MIDIAVVEDEIAALEAENETTYDICERLACLYAVRDQHMEAIKVVYPSEYDAIVAKIRSLHEAT